MRASVWACTRLVNSMLIKNHCVTDFFFYFNNRNLISFYQYTHCYQAAVAAGFFVDSLLSFIKKFIIIIVVGSVGVGFYFGCCTFVIPIYFVHAILLSNSFCCVCVCVFCLMYYIKHIPWIGDPIILKVWDHNTFLSQNLKTHVCVFFKVRSPKSSQNCAFFQKLCN